MVGAQLGQASSFTDEEHLADRASAEFLIWRGLQVHALRGLAPVRSSAARAALRSTRLLLHLFRASYS
ncbi:protein of unknown function [Pseudomonas sp. JV551A1]|nr:protein of unknown function [Pseudomonas sp. JV551A1]